MPEYWLQKIETRVTSVISAEDAAKIVFRAAPSVKVLRALDSSTAQTHDYITIGSYYYKVEKFSIEKILNIFAKRATQLTNVEFESLPEANLVKPIFDRNNIVKVELEDSYFGWYRNISTHHIQNLGIKFKNEDQNMISFEGVGIAVFANCLHFCTIFKQICFFAAFPKLEKIDPRNRSLVKRKTERHVVTNVAVRSWFKVT